MIDPIIKLACWYFRLLPYAPLHLYIQVCGSMHWTVVTISSPRNQNHRPNPIAPVHLSIQNVAVQYDNFIFGCTSHTKMRIGITKSISNKSNVVTVKMAPGGGSLVHVECHMAIKIPPKSMLETAIEPRLSAGRTITTMPLEKSWK